MNEKQEFIYRVSFSEPPLSGDERQEFFFHSLSAIYEVFSHEQIGCRVSRLWNIGVAQGNEYVGRLCQITKEPIMRKKRRNAPQIDANPRCDNLQQDDEKRSKNPISKKIT